MKCHRSVALLALVCLVASPVWAQTRSEEMQRVREQMASLQEKLKALEAGPSSATTNPFFFDGYANIRITGAFGWATARQHSGATRSYHR